MSAPLFLSVFAGGHSNYLSLLVSVPLAAGRGAEESKMNSFCHRPLAVLANATMSRCQIATHPAHPLLLSFSFSQTLLQSSWISMTNQVAMIAIAQALKSLCVCIHLLIAWLNATKITPVLYSISFHANQDNTTEHLSYVHLHGCSTKASMY